MLVVLLPAEGSVPLLGAEPLRRLSQLGVTDVALVRDDTTVGVVLAGWAFNPQRSHANTAEAIGAGAAAQLLMPVMEAAVAADQTIQLTERTSARRQTADDPEGDTQ